MPEPWSRFSKNRWHWACERVGAMAFALPFGRLASPATAPTSSGAPTSFEESLGDDLDDSGSQLTDWMRSGQEQVLAAVGGLLRTRRPSRDESDEDVLLSFNLMPSESADRFTG